MIGRNYVFDANYVFDEKIRACFIGRQDDVTERESFRGRMFPKYHKKIV